MDKSQEIEALRAFIRTMPTDSYIRPMLQNAMPMIEQDMRSDIEPDLPAYLRDLQRQKMELEEEVKKLRKEVVAGTEAVRKQKSEVEYLAREASQLRKQLQGLQERLKAALSW